MTIRSENLLDNLKSISDLYESRFNNFTKADKDKYLEALTVLAKNLQRKLVTICRTTGSEAKLVLHSRDNASFEDEDSYSWGDLMLHIDDAIFHTSSNSFYNYVEKQWEPLGEEMKWIGSDLNIFGEYCTRGKYAAIDETHIFVTTENIEINIKVQIRETLEQTIKI